MIDDRRALIAERDELAERVRQLEAVLHDRDWIPAAWDLTETEATVLNVLVARQVADNESVRFALYGDRLDGGPLGRIVHGWIHKLRAKLAPHGIVIETVWGVGHRLDTASRDVLVALKRAAVDTLSAA